MDNKLNVQIERSSETHDRVSKLLLDQMERSDEPLPLNPQTTTMGWSERCDIDVEKIIKRLHRYFRDSTEDEKVKTDIEQSEAASEVAARMCMDYYRVRNYKNMRKGTEKLKRNKSGSVPIKQTDDVDKAVRYLEKSAIDTGYANSRHALVIPNFVCDEPYPATTDRDVLNRTLQALRRVNGRNHVYVAVGPSIFFDSTKIIEDVSTLAREMDAQILDVHKCKPSSIKVDGDILGSVFLPEEILGIDYILNMPVLKQNIDAGYTASAKNIMGILPSFEKLRFHKLGGKDEMCRAIVDIYTTVNPNINLLDARKILIAAQQREYGGREIEGPGIFISDDGLCADLEAAMDANYMHGCNYFPESTISYFFKTNCPGEIQL